MVILWLKFFPSGGHEESCRASMTEVDNTWPEDAPLTKNTVVPAGATAGKTNAEEDREQGDADPVF